MTNLCRCLDLWNVGSMEVKMKINSSRNSLLRSRNLRSAKRSRVGQILGSRTSRTGSSSGKSSTKRTTSSSYAKSQSKQLAMYEKVEESANSIQKNVNKMLSIGRTTYTDDEAGKKAQENDKELLLKGIKNFVSDFNTTYSSLLDIGGSANLAYKKTLDSIVDSNEEALKAVGVTVSRSGELSIDEKVLESADYEKVKALFAKTNGFADKISAKMDTIEDMAATTLNSLNKLYGATSTYNKYGTSNSYFNSGYNNYNNYNNYNYGGYNSSSWYF